MLNWLFGKPKPQRGGLTSSGRYDRLATGRSIPRGNIVADEVIGRRSLTRMEGGRGVHSGRGRHGRARGR